MFDREYALKQIKLLPDAELTEIVINKESGDYVPEYVMLVMQELKARGKDLAAVTEKPAPATEPVEEVKLAKNVEVASVIAEKIKHQLNLEGLSTSDLAQLYVWESKTPYVMAILESELRKRKQDPKQFLTTEIESGEEVKACVDCGVQPKTGDNFCCNCGAPLTKQH